MGDHSKMMLIHNKDNPSEWTVKHTRPKGRARRAAQHAQIMFLLRNRGFYVDDQGERIDEAAYRAKLRADLHKRLSGAVIYYQVNVDRAMDIARHREKSKWWEARFSTAHAGSDRRGIMPWVNKFLTRIEKEKARRTKDIINTMHMFIE